MSEPDGTLKAAEEPPRQGVPELDPDELAAFVQPFFDRAEVFLAAARKHGSPLYILEERVLRDRAVRFCDAFRSELPRTRVYYAVKSNNCPAVAEILVRTGLGLDVSSGLELEMALGCGAGDVVLSGPAKLDAELALAIEHRDSVTVLMDSFRELDRLEQMAGGAEARVRAGVRLTTDERGLWRKFGIPLADLARFFDAAERCPHVGLRGIQFHTSWNLDPGTQVAFIARLGEALSRLDARHRERIEFIDVGGGYWPPQGEWLHPTDAQLAAPVGNTPLRHHRCPAQPIETFARAIGEAVRTHILPCVACCICAEPGRWLCNDAMHILLTVVDRKCDDIAVTDGGTNAVGWERFETDYFPVLNLTRPSLVERPCYILGSLCTPHDVWGYACHGTDIQPGDVLLIPTQGAYTYSLRQHFIKPLPKLVTL